MSTFKRVEYKFKGPLEIATHDLSTLTSDLKPSEIIVKVKAAALNPVDLVLYNSHSYIFFKRNTKGISRDFAGEITHIGDEKATNFKVGDVISGIFEPIFSEQGTLAEYLKLDLNANPNIGIIPKNLTIEQAASFPLVFGTAFTLFTHHKKPTSDSSVLVIGGGTSVGWYALQLLKKHFNAGYVASVNSGKSTKRVESIGVDKIIDYTKGDVVEQTLEAIKANGGKKFDLILDTVGDSHFFPVINDVLKPKTEDSGYVTIVGDHVADYSSSFFNFFSLRGIYKNLFPQSFNYKMSGIQHGGWYELAVKLFEEGSLDTLIDSTYSLENFQQGIDKLIDHKAQGKVVIDIAK